MCMHMCISLHPPYMSYTSMFEVHQMWGQGWSLNCFTSSSSSVVGNSQTAVVRGCTGSAIRAHSKAWQLSKLSLLIQRNCRHRMLKRRVRIMKNYGQFRFASQIDVQLSIRHWFTLPFRVESWRSAAWAHPEASGQDNYSRPCRVKHLTWAWWDVRSAAGSVRYRCPTPKRVDPWRNMWPLRSHIAANVVRPSFPLHQKLSRHHDLDIVAMHYCAPRASMDPPRAREGQVASKHQKGPASQTCHDVEKGLAICWSSSKSLALLERTAPHEERLWEPWNLQLLSNSRPFFSTEKLFKRYVHSMTCNVPVRVRVVNWYRPSVLSCERQNC